MRTEFSQKVLDIDSNGNIIEIGTKILYNLDDMNKTFVDWIKEPTKNQRTKIEYPNFTSGIKIDNTSNVKTLDNSMGEFVCDTPQVQYNQITVSIFPGKPKNLRSPISIVPQNFIRCLTAFTARLVIDCDWTNGNDEYMVPNENHPKFQRFQNDSIIFSLFSRKSQQSSLRQIDYHNKKWDIKNEFFWLSNDSIKNLAEQNNNEDCYNDCIKFPDNRYLNTVLVDKLNKKEPFTPQALKVLSTATKLLVDTFKYRKDFNNEHPDYQINNWDCGWYQIKAVCKQYMKKEYDEFRTEYLKLRDELRPLVYELGFLKP